MIHSSLPLPSSCLLFHFISFRMLAYYGNKDTLLNQSIQKHYCSFYPLKRKRGIKNMKFLDYFTIPRTFHILSVKGDFFFLSTVVLISLVPNLFPSDWQTILSSFLLFQFIGKIKLYYFLGDTTYLQRFWIFLYCFELWNCFLSYSSSFPFSLRFYPPHFLFSFPVSFSLLLFLFLAHICTYTLFLSYLCFKFLETSLGHSYINFLVVYLFFSVKSWKTHLVSILIILL